MKGAKSGAASRLADADKPAAAQDPGAKQDIGRRMRFIKPSANAAAKALRRDHPAHQPVTPAGAIPK